MYETERDHGSRQNHDHWVEKGGCHELVYLRETTIATNEQSTFTGSLTPDRVGSLQVDVRTQESGAKLQNMRG